MHAWNEIDRHIVFEYYCENYWKKFREILLCKLKVSDNLQNQIHTRKAGNGHFLTVYLIMLTAEIEHNLILQLTWIYIYFLLLTWGCMYK